MWLKAYGAGVIAVSEKKSKEYWHPYTAPEKIEALLPILWREDGVAMCKVPLRETGLARVVPEGAVVRHGLKPGEDMADVRKYVAALDDEALPRTDFTWEGRNRIRIHTTVTTGQVISVQVSYHPGWHATAGKRSIRVEKDGLV
jgi:hypothetical protein